MTAKTKQVTVDEDILDTLIDYLWDREEEDFEQYLIDNRIKYKEDHEGLKEVARGEHGEGHIFGILVKLGDQ